jgi:hypothetical protein
MNWQRCREMCRVVLGLLVLTIPFGTQALDLDIRLKWFGSAALLPSHDIQRQQAATPAYDNGADLRLMFRQRWRSFSMLADHSTTLIAGDSFAFNNVPQTSLDQTPVDDDARIMDLTWEIEDGDRHRSLHRLDRLALQYRKGPWALTVGRQAVSWGNGMAFSPMDLISPFAPTVVDQDYKAGDDLLLIERLFDSGSDLQLLTVGRRDQHGDIAGAAASAALKWHGFVGDGELEVLAAKHYQDRVLALSGRVPLGGAMLRSDIVATRLDDGDVVVSGVVNLDYSVVLNDMLVYAFAEYYRNGFGVKEMPDNVTLIPDALRVRLQRGEVFNIMRNYAAVGLAVPWHPLLNQSLTLLLNIDDSSSLLQTSVTYDRSDHQRIQLGIVAPLGRAGDEFGGVPLLGTEVTAGGGTRVFLRWVRYF